MLSSDKLMSPEDRLIYSDHAPIRKFECPCCSADGYRPAEHVEMYRGREAMCDWLGSAVWFAIRCYRNTPATALALLDGPFEISSREAFDLDLRPE